MLLDRSRVGTTSGDLDRIWRDQSNLPERRNGNLLTWNKYPSQFLESLFTRIPNKLNEIIIHIAIKKGDVFIIIDHPNSMY